MTLQNTNEFDIYNPSNEPIKVITNKNTNEMDYFLTNNEILPFLIIRSSSVPGPVIRRRIFLIS